LKNIIFHIKLFRHFEFSRKSFILTQNIKKMEKNIIFENIDMKNYKQTKTVRSAIFVRSAIENLTQLPVLGVYLHNLINQE
jgi:hypothetical protein